MKKEHLEILEILKSYLEENNNKTFCQCLYDLKIFQNNLINDKKLLEVVKNKYRQEINMLFQDKFDGCT
jgi:hypothetical protein